MSTGVSQSHRVVSGSLATVKTVGNLNTVKMIKQVGLWAIRMDSSEPYHLKVVGEKDLTKTLLKRHIEHNNI